MKKKMKQPTATNFFERQESARKRTWILTPLYCVAVLGTWAVLWGGIVLVGAYFGGLEPAEHSSRGLQFNGEHFAACFDWLATNETLFIFCGLAVFLFVLGGTISKAIDLAREGAYGVAEKLGGTRIDRSATDLNEKRFYNVVEEMALAAGVPVPAVYVLRKEDGINACAIGGDVGSSAIAATAGAIRLLTRDELQGVVAHEFAHLVNGDVKINMRLISLIFGLEALTITGCAIMSAADKFKNNGDKAFVAMLGLPMALGGGVGVFFGEGVRAAVSRQRELLADASAALFTRNPQGLANALKKIGGYEKKAQVDAPGAVETAHLFFCPAFDGLMGLIFRTHPDLTERILALDPTFDGKFPKSDDVRAAKSAEERRAKAKKVKKGQKVQTSTRPKLPTLDGAAVASALVASIGELRPEKLVGVSATLREIPAAFETLLEDFDGARLLLFALLVDVDAWATLAEQRDAICRRDAEAFYRRVVATAETLRALPFSTRSAIARLAVPTLKSGKVDDYKRFRETVFALCDADGRRNLFEFALQTSVIRELDVWFRLAPFPKTKFSAFSDVREAFQTAATELAVRGADGDETEARRAFAASISALGDVAKSTEPLEPQELENVDLETLYEAVDVLAQTTPRLKEKLLTAFFACVAADGRVTETEAELFDAISLALGVPAPVWRSVVDASEAAAKSEG